MSTNILEYGVIGDPIKHSLSPLMHQKAFDELAIPAKYSAFHVIPKELSSFMDRFKNPAHPMQGLSVTLPHKQTIIPYVDELTELADQIGAVNTLYWDSGKLIGHNTDVEGFLAPLKKMKPNNIENTTQDTAQNTIEDTSNLENNKDVESFCESALILGAGGAACAVFAGLLTLKNIKYIYISARRLEQAQSLMDSILPKFIKNSTYSSLPKIKVLPYTTIASGFDLVINTIPAAIQTHPFSPIERFESVKLAYDLVYFQTPFLDIAKQQGVQILDGSDMFICQGAAQFHLWTQKRMPQNVHNMMQDKLSNKGE